jgi:DUF1009 family protein
VSNAADSAAAGALAIICGGGSFPFVVAEAAVQHGRRIVLFALTGFADPAAVARYPHHWIALGQAGRFFRLAHAEACRDVVFIGAVTRPSLRRVRLDLMTLRLFPRIVRMFHGGDNHLLTAIADVFQEQGLRLVGAHEVAPEILVPEGVLGRHAPTAPERADIACALALMAATGPFDVGQAVVVADRRVLAVEAAEGTDDMLARVAALRAAKRLNLPARHGVLVKAPKPGQERRLDLPSVGIHTVDGAARAGLAGIAVEAAGAITADLQQLICAADAAGLFVFGARRNGST